MGLGVQGGGLGLWLLGPPRITRWGSRQALASSPAWLTDDASLRGLILMSPTVLTVVGARPQFIKAAPVSRALAEAGFRELLVHTGQHYDHGMSEVFFQELGLPQPWKNLAVGSGSHAVQTGAMLPLLESAMLEARPDLVLVYGDTNSTLAGTLAAAKLNLPVAHVEAGLRSFNRAMPEEVNRLVADVLARWCFAPTEAAQAHLLREGVAPDAVRLVGDVMADAVLHFGAEARPLEGLGVAQGGYLLCTLHRASLVDQPALLTGAWKAIGALAARWPVVLPLHPRTRAAVDQLGLAHPSGLQVLSPQGYVQMLGLLRGAKAVVTDSGGLQKEAFLMRRPCVTMRDETEWVELVEGGWNHLVGEAVDGAKLEVAVEAQLNRSFSEWPPLYGDGQASQRIAQFLRQAFGAP